MVTPWNNEHWTVASVGTIVRNRVYLGEARAGKIVNPDAHKPIVTLAEWQAANKARGVHPGRSGKGTGLLSGVLRCGGCSYAMKPKMGKTRHGKDFLEYGCKPDKAGGRCPAPASVKASVIEPFVLSHLFAFAKNATAHTQEEDGSNLDAELAAAEAERDAALDERLAEALGGRNPMCTCARSKAVKRGLTRCSKSAPNAIKNGSRLRSRPTLSRFGTTSPSKISAAYSTRSSIPFSSGEPAIAGATESCRSLSERAYFSLVKDRPVPIRGQRGRIRTLPLDSPAAAEAP